MILKLLEQRAPRTICPSEAARLIDAKAWREWMPAVREAAERLAKRGRLDILQKGEKVDMKRVRGPIRLGREPSKRPQVRRGRANRGSLGSLGEGASRCRVLPDVAEAGVGRRLPRNASDLAEK